MEKREPKLSNKNSFFKPVIFSIFLGLIVAGFWVFGNPNQKTSISAPVQNGLVGYWTMDNNDLSGTTIYDKSGKGNNGTLYGGVTTGQTGVLKEAFGFSAGTQKYVLTPATPVNTTLTLEAWIYPTTYPGERMTIIQGTAPAYYLSFASDGSLQCYWYDTLPAGYHSSGAGTVGLNTWSHVVATWDGSYVKLFVNGAKKNEVQVTGTGRVPGSNNIGAESSSRQFVGKIDEVRIYNRALSAEEIKQNYEATRRTYITPSLKDRFSDGLVGYWTFDGPDIQGLNATATDVSGNGNNGKIYGAVTAPGKVGQALQFDGVDDYVDCGNGASLNFDAGDFTVEVWAKALGGITGRGIINKGGWHSIGYSIQQAYSPANTYYFVVRDSAGYKYVNLGLYETWDWTHIVGVKKTNYIEAWVNGKKVGSLSETIGSLSQPTKKFEIGRSYDPYYFNGLIDEVRIYNRALTAEEIQQHYQAGIHRTEIQPQ